MGVVKEFGIEKHYDPVADSLYILIIDDYKYMESMDMGENVILDFDKHHVPVALEIVDASKIQTLNCIKFFSFTSVKLLYLRGSSFLTVKRVQESKLNLLVFQPLEINPFFIKMY